MEFLWIILGAVALILCLLLLGAYAAYRMAFRYRAQPPEDPFSTLSRHPEFEAVRRRYIEKLM